MVPIRKTDLVDESDAEATLISYHQGICKAVELNSTGYRVWQLIDGKRSICEIASLLVASLSSMLHFDHDSVQRDIDRFVIALEKEGFLCLQADGPEES